MGIFFDQLDRKVEVKNLPKRVVSLVPSQTELLVDLGLEDRLVGVTKFCVHPRNLRKEKTVVGGTKQVHSDRISRLAPDLVLCNKEENTPAIVEELEELAPVHVSDVKTINGSIELIREYGEIFQVRKNASALAGRILDLRDKFTESVAGTPRRRVVYFIWKDPWMVAGSDTFINHLLELNNFENVFAAEKSRYPEVELEQVEEKNPDFIFLSTEPFPFKKEDERFFKKPGEKDFVHIVDGEFFSWYGSRLVSAFSYFDKLHRDLS